MRQQTRTFTCSTAFAAALFAGMGAGAQDTHTVPDAQVEANVLRALAGAPQLTSEDIKTNTVHGTVTLTGSVKDEPTRQMAENLAARAPGVKKVVDELTLGYSASTEGNADQGTNPMLQSDGTMAQAGPPQQHAPDPDVYAAQHGAGQQGDPQHGIDGPDQNRPGNVPQPAPVYRAPYGADGNSQQPGPGYPGGYPAQPGSYPAQPGGYPAQSGGYPGQPGGYPPQAGGYPPQPGNYPRRQQDAPPPYGAQLAGQPVTVPQGALLRIRINEGLDSRHAQPGTPFDAVVLNDVVADGAVAIPRGAAVSGKVTEVKNGGVLRGHGELSLQLTQVTLGGKSFPLVTDAWTRDGQGKGGQTAGNAIGLGAAGAVIGAIAGGGAGAGIGAVAGGAVGLGASAASGSREVLIPSEAILTFHTAQPAPMTTISQAEMDRLSSGVPTGAQQTQMRRRYAPPPPYYGPVYYPRPYGYPY